MTRKEQRYDLYLSVFDKLKSEWIFNCFSEMIVSKNSVTAWLATEERKYLIKLRKRKYNFSSFKKSDISDKIMEPDWNQKGKYKKAQELYNCLNSFFVYLEEYDPSLKSQNKGL